MPGVVLDVIERLTEQIRACGKLRLAEPNPEYELDGHRANGGSVNLYFDTVEGSLNVTAKYVTAR